MDLVNFLARSAARSYPDPFFSAQLKRGGSVLTDPDAMTAQLEALLKQYQGLDFLMFKHGPAASQRGDKGPWDVDRLVLHRIEAAIARLAPPGSVYITQLNGYLGSTADVDRRAPYVFSLARALLADLQEGWVKTLAEQVHADTYASYLDMAEGLLENGFKDAAAVIAGTSLEVHVRELCMKSAVPIEVNGKWKKADTMNADLKKAGVYGTLQQKQVTAWMDLRNKAAHGNYGEYDQSEVRSLIRGVRDFMLKYPA
ncbi:hypothetical protein ACFY6U_45860 [Streptomyces sp. NPDC013157]|uniref:hypothetical protein n=1 Tax=Streptomyces sp. NPDC013157 TaxID=3364861 RepID=UPI00368F19B8